MARSINKVTLIGTLGRDPEIKYLPNGTAAARLSMATDESYNDKNTGARVEQTEWHRIVIYGKLAEIAHQYLRKGSKAYFEGSLKTREWEKEGVRRFTTEVIAREMVMLDGRSQQDEQPQPQPQPVQEQPQQRATLPHQPRQNSNHTQQSYTAPTPQQQPDNFDDFDDDIPF